MSDRRDEPFTRGAAEAARLAQEVQDLGFHAATTIVERFAGLFGQFASNGSANGPCQKSGEAAVRFGGSDSSVRNMRRDMQHAADSYLAVLGQLNEAGLRLFDATGRWEPPAPEHADLSLPDVRPGGRVSARVWLHNTTNSAVVALRPWCPGLTSHTGVALPPGAVTCTPERIDHLDSRASSEVLVSVSLEDDAARGWYHGQLLVDGLPEVAFPVRVRVVPIANDQ